MNASVPLLVSCNVTDKEEFINAMLENFDSMKPSEEILNHDYGVRLYSMLRGSQPPVTEFLSCFCVVSPHSMTVERSVSTYNMFSRISERQPQRRRYPDILPKDTLPKDTLPKDILPNGHFSDGHFAERTFCRTNILPNGHFAERTVCRKDNLPKIKMLFRQNVWDYDSFLNCLILNHCVK